MWVNFIIFLYSWKYLLVIFFFFCTFWDFSKIMDNCDNFSLKSKPKCVILMISGSIGNWPNDKPKLWKPISPFHPFQYSKGQMGIISLRIVKFQNFSHHYKWKNVYFNNIPITQLWPCAQKSHILTKWVTNVWNEV